jgi:putative ubiquitin-RnfH superfamily antitoxin RatB of RatAB toxin-antitoxin module
MDRAEAGATIRVAVAWSPKAGEAFEVALELPAGATTLDAIRASGLLEGEAGIDISTQPVGIWGRAATLDSVLTDRDRVEIYRPLAINPKEARRRRAQGHR